MKSKNPSVISNELLWGPCDHILQLTTCLFLFLLHNTINLRVVIFKAKFLQLSDVGEKKCQFWLYRTAKQSCFLHTYMIIMKSSVLWKHYVIVTAKKQMILLNHCKMIIKLCLQNLHNVVLIIINLKSAFWTENIPWIEDIVYNVRYNCKK